MQLTANLSFKPIEADFVDRFLSKSKFAPTAYDAVHALVTDIQQLGDLETRLLFDDGVITLELCYFWLKNTFNIYSKVVSNGGCSYWIDLANKKYYDGSPDVTLDLMANSLLWENNHPHLAYVWGTALDERLLATKREQAFDGVLLPCLEGWGVIALLKTKSIGLLDQFGMDSKMT